MLFKQQLCLRWTATSIYSNQYQLILEQMGKMIDQYRLDDQIERDVYFTVFRGTDLHTNHQVAIKQISKQKVNHYPKLDQVLQNEISIFKSLQNCPHIIRYLDLLKTNNNFYFVYQYCNGGTLQQMLKYKVVLHEKQALPYFHQILQAFRVLNRQNIMHRDFKPKNILLHNGIIKITNFGFSKPLERDEGLYATMLSSPIYTAPEVLRGKSYSIKSDIWSIGVVLFQMLYGYCPFQSNNIAKLITLIYKQDLIIPQKPVVSPQVINLIRRMLTKDERQRVGWPELFCYEVRHGQLYKNGLRQTCNSMKSSSTISEVTATYSSPFSPPQQLIQYHDIEPSKSGQALNDNDSLKNHNSCQTTNVYSVKGCTRQKFRKEQFIKNHMRTLEMISLAVSLASYDISEALGLSYLIVLDVQKELLSLMISLQVDSEINEQQQIIRNFIFTVHTELSEMKTLTIHFRDSLREELGTPIESIDSQKRQLLKRFVYRLYKNDLQQLVLASRIIDYILEKLVIRRQTFEKMSRQRLLNNILLKTQLLN